MGPGGWVMGRDTERGGMGEGDREWNREGAGETKRRECCEERGLGRMRVWKEVRREMENSKRWCWRDGVERPRRQNREKFGEMGEI